MGTLVYFAIWAAVIFVMMRFGCGAHITGHGHGNEKGRNASANVGGPELRWTPPSRDTDPVCGKSVATDKAKSSVHDGNVYYFCSRECREVFEAAPNLYLDGDTHPQNPEHSHA